MQQEMGERYRQRVLVIEDDPWVRLFVSDILRGQGFDAVQASNGHTGLRIAIREPPSLVVLDLCLPEMSGLEVLAELQRQPATQAVPVLVMSANTGLLGEADRRRLVGILAKPFKPDQLLALVERAMSVN